MKKRIYQVDAFTSIPYTGNPAGVVLDATGLTDNQMLKIAREMNLSETAFVFPGSETYDVEVRFFTPTEEVDLCGHATIATFTLLRKLGLLPSNKNIFIQKTKAGNLDVKFEDDNVIMRQAEPRKIEKKFTHEDLCNAMNLDLSQIGIDVNPQQSRLMSEIWSTGLEDILLPVKSLDILKKLAPNMTALSDLSNSLDVVGIHAFTIDDGNIWCRNFAPAFGIPEESATGTSNGALGAYLYHHQFNNGKNLTFTAKQGDWMDSPSRIFVQVQNADSLEVWVGGQAVIVLEGDIVIA